MDEEGYIEALVRAFPTEGKPKLPKEGYSEHKEVSLLLRAPWVAVGDESLDAVADRGLFAFLSPKALAYYLPAFLRRFLSFKTDEIRLWGDPFQYYLLFSRFFESQSGRSHLTPPQAALLDEMRDRAEKLFDFNLDR